jgi:hypothetical protein
VDVYLAGVDYTLKSNIVIGLAIAVDRSDIKLKGTSFGAAGGTMDGDGTTYTLYAGIPLNKNWSADLSAGWGKTEVTTKVFGTKGEMDDDRTVFTRRPDLSPDVRRRQQVDADRAWRLYLREGQARLLHHVEWHICLQRQG